MRSSRTGVSPIMSGAAVVPRTPVADITPPPPLATVPVPDAGAPAGGDSPPPTPQAPVVHEVTNPPTQVRSPVRPNNVRDLEPGVPVRTADHIVELRADGSVVVTPAAASVEGDRDRAELLKPGATAVAVLGDLTVVLIRTPTTSAADAQPDAGALDPRAADLAGYDASTPTPTADPGGSEVDDGQN